MRKIAVLGSTGSIGQQTLDIIRNHPADFEVAALSGYTNIDLLLQQVDAFRPHCVCIGETQNNPDIQSQIEKKVDRVYRGENGLTTMIDDIEADIVVVAIVGFAGLAPALHAIKKGAIIALANKECLVVAGELIMTATQRHNTTIYPIDSEHSAIFQALVGEDKHNIEKIILTASGGPFIHFSKQELENATLEQAIRHPNWNMGDKITIDSATMMNKGFEIIEAKWLFDIPIDKIQVVIHPQSVLHSAVQFCDGSIKAQLGTPDMHLPIQYALYYPKRTTLNRQRLDWNNLQMTFAQPDTERFSCLNLATTAMKKGGNMTCALNAANEIANRHFREKKCKFNDIPDTIKYTLQHIRFIPTPDYNDILTTHREATKIALNYLQQKYPPLP